MMENKNKIKMDLSMFDMSNHCILCSDSGSVRTSQMNSIV